MNAFGHGPFDAAFYLATYSDVAQSGMDPEEHYRHFGRVEGRAANANELNARGAERFDARFYLSVYADVASAGIDPYEHYIRFGKDEGRSPFRIDGQSAGGWPNMYFAAEGYPDFQPEFYFEAFPDVAASGISAFDHYLRYGRYEGRVTHPIDLSAQWRDAAADPLRDTILLVSHDASRTGAPVLAWNVCRKLGERFNVVSILLAGGALVDHFRETCWQTVVLQEPELRHPLVLDRLVRDIGSRRTIRWAIVNSIEARMAMEPLAKYDYPILMLIHEYISYTPLRSSVVSAMNHASTVVFSAASVRDDAISEETAHALASSVILRQGKCVIPSLSSVKSATGDELTRPIDPIDQVVALLYATSPKRRLVLGAGTVQFRKGVDLFIATAAEFIRARPGDDTLFVWVGDDPEMDLSYTACLQVQLRDPFLIGRVLVMKSTSRLEELYSAADVFFLSSRLDPLPNVAIDAMTAGLPLVCFENTGGIAEILQECDCGNACIAPFSNTVQAAGRISELLDHEELRTRVGLEIQSVAQHEFDMDSYVNSLLDLLHRVKS